MVKLQMIVKIVKIVKKKKQYLQTKKLMRKKMRIYERKEEQKTIHRTFFPIKWNCPYVRYAFVDC